MKTIHVSTGSPYDIMIERGILDNCGEIIILFFFVVFFFFVFVFFFVLLY